MRVRKKDLCVCGRERTKQPASALSADKRHDLAISKLGLSQTREYNRFYQAKQRCMNPKNDRYHEYGGRGIEWRFKSYEEIYIELGPCPDGLSLDRINNNGHYEKGNVRWATRAEQYASRRPWNWARKLMRATESTSQLAVA